MDDEPEGRGTGYGFVAVWQMPSTAEVETFRAVVSGAGWYTYFDQINIASLLVPPEVVIERLVAS